MKRRPWLDLTHPIIPGQNYYPGDPAPVMEELASIEDEGYRLTRLNFVPHAGTHLDAPAHFIAYGDNIDALSLERLIGPAVIIDIPDMHRSQGIGSEILEQAARIRQKFENLEGIHELNWHNWMLLLRCVFTTKAGAPLARYTQAWLRDETAKALVLAGISLVGTDQFDLESPGDSDFPIHQRLLKESVLLLENLDLSETEQCVYDVIVLPLKFAGAEAGPARVIARCWPAIDQ